VQEAAAINGLMYHDILMDGWAPHTLEVDNRSAAGRAVRPGPPAFQRTTTNDNEHQRTTAGISGFVSSHGEQQVGRSVPDRRSLG
jgi:hypothetical protein